MKAHEGRGVLQSLLDAEPDPLVRRELAQLIECYYSDRGVDVTAEHA
jgi:hypothetical protein